MREIDYVEGAGTGDNASTSFGLNGKPDVVHSNYGMRWQAFCYGPDDEKWRSTTIDPDETETKFWDIDRTYWDNYECVMKDFHYREYYFLDNDVIIIRDSRDGDPTIGRFLSPDNYVQLPENSQSFNRYSYCINNPLKYTDPTGQLFGIDDAVIAFAVFNMASSMMMAAANGESVWKAAGISLLSSAATYGIGSLFSGPLQGISGTFGGELLRAGAHGLASGVTSALSGGNFGRGFVSGAASSGIGSFASGIDMNDGLMLASCATMGGLT